MTRIKMAPNRTSTPWAQTQDWVKHRTIITDLYVNKRKKMKDVIQTMAEEHGFHATRRMYKTRFTKWGLTKNTKSKPACVEDARPAVCTRRLVTSASGSLETDRRLKRPVAPMMGVAHITNHGSIHAPRHLRAQPAIRRMEPPGCYKFAEGTFRYMEEYINSIGFPSLGSSISDKRLVTLAPGAEWLNCVTTAKTLLTSGHFQQAVLLIDVCCHQYKSLLCSQDLSLVAITIAAILKVLYHWPGLAHAVLEFVCKMSQIVLGLTHPLSVLFQKFKEAGVDHLGYCISITLQHFLGGIVHIMPHPMMESYGEIYYDMFRGKILDKSTTLSEFQHLQHRLQHRLQGQPREKPQGQTETQSDLIEDTTTMQCRIAWLYFHGKRYGEATNLIMEMLSEPTVDAHVTAGCYDILHNIAVAQNNHDLALDMIQKAAEASVEAYGSAHCTTTRKMVLLESCLRSMGRLSEADEVHSTWEMQLAQICDRTQK